MLGEEEVEFHVGQAVGREQSLGYFTNTRKNQRHLTDFYVVSKAIMPVMAEYA